MLTKWWIWELMLTTSFGSPLQMVTKVGSKFGFVPDWLVGSFSIHLRVISQKMLKAFMIDKSLKITHSKVQHHLPGANELKKHIRCLQSYFPQGNNGSSCCLETVCTQLAISVITTKMNDLENMAQWLRAHFNIRIIFPGNSTGFPIIKITWSQTIWSL